MIKREFYKTRSDGVSLYKTYSDSNYLIKQVETNSLYQEAIDIENAPYTYEETDILIEEEATEQDYLEALAKLGVK